MSSIQEYVIDVRVSDLLSRLRRRWRWITLCGAAAFVLGIIYLKLATHKYTVTLNVTPVQDQSSALSAQFGDIANLVGVSLPVDSEESLFQLYRTALRSQVGGRAIAENPVLMQKLFAEEWSATDRQWKEPAGLVSMARAAAVAILGKAMLGWTPPSLGRVTEFLRSDVRITEDRDSPMLSLSLNHADPDLAGEILLSIHNAADAMLRERVLNRTTAYIEYLTRKLDATKVAEYRQALVDTLSSQEKLRMFASSDTRFVADVFDRIVVSDKPTVPNPLFVLSFSIVFGCFTGMLIVVLKSQSSAKQQSLDGSSGGVAEHVAEERP